MESTSSNNGNLLVYAVGVVAAVGLIIGIYGMTKVSKTSTALNDMATRLDTIETQAKKASDDSSRAVSRITGLATDTNRALDAVGAELAGLRTSVSKLQTDTKAATDKLADLETHGGSRSSSGGGAGSSGPSIPLGTLGEDGTYVIKGGDTFGKLAAKFGTTISEIQKANPGVDPARLKIGQKIVIPKKG